jgi:hypothetical protein
MEAAADLRLRSSLQMEAAALQTNKQINKQQTPDLVFFFTKATLS